MEYIFNDCVIFKDNEGLRFKRQVQVVAPMSVLQAGVLVELIKAQGKPVHRDYLLEHVWEENGYLASNNSLNHNIGYLRKALKKCGICEAIITVHRVGFKLNKAVDVQVCFPELVFPPQSEDASNNTGEHFLPKVSRWNSTQGESLGKQWASLWKWMNKKKFAFLLYALMPPAVILIVTVFYVLRPVAEARHYVAMVDACKTRTVYHFGDDQKK